MLTLSEKVGTSIQFLYGGKIYPIRVTAAVTHYIAELRLQGSGYRDDRGRDLLLKVKVNKLKHRRLLVYAIETLATSAPKPVELTEKPWRTQTLTLAEQRRGYLCWSNGSWRLNGC